MSMIGTGTLIEAIKRVKTKRKRRYLTEVFEDDGDVHVDDDKEGDDEVGNQVDDGQSTVATVSARLVFCRRRITVVVHETSQYTVPPRRRGDLEEKDNAAKERFKVEHVVDAGRVTHVHEEGHSEDGVDEHDKEEEETDVE